MGRSSFFEFPNSSSTAWGPSTMDSFYRPNYQLFAQPGTATVVETITLSRRGRVRYLSSYWPARLHQGTSSTQLTPEQTVLVLGREGMTLLIQPK
jgi:hypothetical protein